MGSYITSVFYETIVIYKLKVTGFIHPISKVLQWKSSSSTETTNPTQYLAVLLSHDSTKMPYMNAENKQFSEHPRETSSCLKLQFSLGFASPHHRFSQPLQAVPQAQATLSPVPASWALLSPAPQLRTGLDGLIGMQLFCSSVGLSFACSLPPDSRYLTPAGRSSVPRTAEGPSFVLRSQLGMLGIRPQFVVSHHGRKRLVNVVHYYK